MNNNSSKNLNYSIERQNEIRQSIGCGQHRKVSGGVISAIGQKSLKHEFQKLCNELRPYLQKNPTRFRNSIFIEKQVATTLYYLADERLRKRKVA